MQTLCNLYLAPSSIPGAGLGVFTTRNIPRGSMVGSPEIGIPFIDRTIHSKRKMIIADYAWDGTDTFESNEVEMLVPGLGMMTNFHPSLINVVAGYGFYDDRLVSESSDNLGAITYYGEFNMTASRDIVAGEEIFSDYGEQWFHTRPDVHQTTPLSRDYNDADAIMQDITSILNGAGVEQNASDDIIFTVKRIVSRLDIKTASLLPNDAADLDKKQVHGSAWHALTNRSINWLQENGQCFDTILSKKSTIEDVGRGAFAKSFLNENQLIITTPVLPMLREDFAIYKRMFDEYGREESMNQVVVGEQLLLNYCFGHQDTVLILCPSNNAVLINHRSKTDDVGPNAKIQWSTWSNFTMNKLLNMTVDELVSSKANLVIDIIATRSIYPGEEIYLDYGDNWDTKWKQHKYTWTSPKRRHASMAEYNELIQLNSLNTTWHTFPKTSMLTCAVDMNNVKKQESVLKFGQVINGSEYDISRNYDLSFWPCKVVEQTDDFNSYNVEIKLDDIETIKVNFLPIKSIKLVNKKRKSDQFLKGSFREPIGIPSHMIPLHWKMGHIGDNLI